MSAKKTWVSFLAATAVLAMAVGVSSASTIDISQMQRTTSGGLCTVTLQNAWGIPTVVQSGYLLGDGRFLITDLGPLAQSSGVLVVVGFVDGSLAVSTQYGLASPSMGVVMLKVEEAKAEAPPADAAASTSTDAATAPKVPEKPKADPAAASKPPVLRNGFQLAAEMPTLDYNPTVAQAGWRWADEPEILETHLAKGPSVAEFSKLLKIDPPAPPPDAFIKIDGDHLDAATGSPILDREGKVVAMTLEMTSQTGQPIVMGIPMLPLRTMLTSGAVMPEMKPLTELPKSPWPTRGLRMPGKPGVQSDLIKAVGEVTHNMICTGCNGVGRNKAGDGLCTECQGEKRILGKKLTDSVADMVELATRTLWVPSLDDRIRSTMRTAGRDMIRSLTSVGPNFETSFAVATATDLANPGLTFPQGVMLRCEVKEHVNGPDGKYLLVAPWKSNILVAVKCDDMMLLGGKLPMTDSSHKDPADGSWIALIGAGLSGFDTGKAQGMFVLPLEWMLCESPETALAKATIKIPEPPKPVQPVQPTQPTLNQPVYVQPPRIGGFGGGWGRGGGGFGRGGGRGR
jgi:hypothetical protein